MSFARSDIHPFFSLHDVWKAALFTSESALYHASPLLLIIHYGSYSCCRAFCCVLNHLCRVFCTMSCLLSLISSPQCRPQWVLVFFSPQILALCARTLVQVCSISCEYENERVTGALSAGVVFTLTPVIFITGCVVCCYFLNTSHRPVTFTSTGRP